MALDFNVTSQFLSSFSWTYDELMQQCYSAYYNSTLLYSEMMNKQFEEYTGRSANFSTEWSHCGDLTKETSFCSLGNITDAMWVIVFNPSSENLTQIELPVQSSKFRFG